MFGYVFLFLLNVYEGRGIIFGDVRFTLIQNKNNSQLKLMIIAVDDDSLFVFFFFLNFVGGGNLRLTFVCVVTVIFLRWLVNRISFT